MTPSEQEREALEKVLADNCPECGHPVSWHGENHDDGCNHFGGCVCGLNASDCHRKINKSADLAAYRLAVRRAAFEEAEEALVDEVVVDIPQMDFKVRAIKRLTALRGLSREGE